MELFEILQCNHFNDKYCKLQSLKSLTVIILKSTAINFVNSLKLSIICHDLPSFHQLWIYSEQYASKTDMLYLS